jgi:hypothetical protein
MPAIVPATPAPPPMIATGERCSRSSTRYGKCEDNGSARARLRARARKSPSSLTENTLSCSIEQARRLGLAPWDRSAIPVRPDLLSPRRPAPPDRGSTRRAEPVSRSRKTKNFCPAPGNLRSPGASPSGRQVRPHSLFGRAEIAASLDRRRPARRTTAARASGAGPARGRLSRAARSARSCALRGRCRAGAAARCAARDPRSFPSIG